MATSIRLAAAVIKRVPVYASLLILLFACPATSWSFEGPLRVKNQFPLFLHALPPYLETALPESSFSATLLYSSVYTVEGSRNWRVDLDMELAEVSFTYRRTFLNTFEFSIDVPFLSFNSGFMDGFLSAYHRAFGLPDYGRSDRPENEFLYEVKRNGDLTVKGESGKVRLGDIRLSVKKEILTGNPVLSVKADIELPTGDAERGYGNGSVDVGFGLLLDATFSQRFKGYATAGVVLPGKLRALTTVDLRPFPYGGAGIEYSLSERIGLLAQFMAQGSPLPKTDISSVDRTSVLLTLGSRYVSGRNSMEISLTEDPNTAGAPDFTMAFSYKRRF